MSYDYAAPPFPENDPGSEKRSGRHPVNIGHLVMGLVFLTFVGVWAVVETGAFVVNTVEDLRWLLPLPWIIGGGAGLIATLLRSRR